MSNEHIGWLPYGSDHESILFSCPMTSEASILAIPAASVTTNGGNSSTFDSVRGMICKDSNGDATNGYYIGQMTGLADLNNGGQMSFQLEKSYLSDYDETYGSYGTDISTSRAVNPTFFSCRDEASLYWQYAMARYDKVITFKKTSTNLVVNTFYDGQDRSDTENYLFFTESNHPEFVTVNIGWYKSGGDLILFIAYDGVMAFKSTLTGTFTGNIFDRFVFGCLLTTTNTSLYDAYMRNFQISSLCPSFGHNANVGTILLWSDSLFGNPTSMDTPSVFANSTTSGGVRQYLGESCPRVDIIQNSGYGLTVPANKFSASVSTAIAKGAKTVAFIGGTNDMNEGGGNGTFDDAAWDTAYKTNLSALFDAGTDNIIVCTITSPRFTTDNNHSGFVADKVKINTKIRDLVSGTWLADNHPTKTLLLCDLDEAFGYEIGDANNFIGGFDGTNTNLHWSSKGHAIAGKEIGKVIKESLYI